MDVEPLVGGGVAIAASTPPFPYRGYDWIAQVRDGESAASPAGWLPAVPFTRLAIVRGGRLEFDHDLEVALGGKPTIDNTRLLCKSHNLMKAEQHLGKALMAKFRKGGPVERDTSSG